jgi:hypothetical protein
MSAFSILGRGGIGSSTEKENENKFDRFNF